MNKETLAKKATLALTAAAAKKESETDKSVKSTPSPDAVAAIDDVLSVVKNYSFYGSGTKTYKNPKDELSGSYCTAPVKYEFKDKETRTAAEKILKSTCGISCTTPYPAMVRECIKQIIDDVKKEYPDNFIWVAVDTGKMVLKLPGSPPKMPRIMPGSMAKWIFQYRKRRWISAAGGPPRTSNLRYRYLIPCR
jgi:hypothetical protein